MYREISRYDSKSHCQTIFEINHLHIHIRKHSSYLIDRDPMQFWFGSEIHRNFSLLSTVARRLDAIPTITSSVERLFSSTGLIFTQRRTRLSLNYITRKLEEKIGVDLNGDGRIGGPGITSKLEQATHVDVNRDGIIGGYRPPPGGGLVGKIERMTHIDLNRDGYIGGRPGNYWPPQQPCHKKKH
ncbi:unnamed protein product [Rotaria sp. Silwood2]|nr:unnamed protein product [Rotaria sp. Silwood2]